MKKPNIVYFVADQMRLDSLHHMGNNASITPNLDSLAQNDGVSFRNAYCQNPVCVPSRNSFLSGLYPHTTGHRTMHFLQGNDDPNILKVMKESGYEVIWVGRNDVVPANKSKADYCDEYYDGNDHDNKIDPQKPMHYAHSQVTTIGPDLYSFYIGKADRDMTFVNQDWVCIENALSYLDRKALKKDDKPFFLYITLMYPHPPYVCEEPWYSSIDRYKTRS
jgi:arylsulfatase A-like enzyme